MALPVLTGEQRAEALRRSAEARQAASAARAALKAGDISIADVLDLHVPALYKVRVRSVLTLLPGVGKVRAERLLAEAGVALHRITTVRVRGLGDRQRAALRDALTA